jgi:hypothetical protein
MLNAPLGAAKSPLRACSRPADAVTVVALPRVRYSDRLLVSVVGLSSPHAFDRCAAMKDESRNRRRASRP